MKYSASAADQSNYEVDKGHAFQVYQYNLCPRALEMEKIMLADIFRPCAQSGINSASLRVLALGPFPKSLIQFWQVRQVCSFGSCDSFRAHLSVLCIELPPASVSHS